MTKSDFFRLLIKSIGLFFLITTSLTYFPMILAFFISDFYWSSLLFILGGIGFLALVYIFFILKTDQIIQLLNLEKGFDDSKFDLGYLTKQGLFQLALLIVGLSLMFGVLSDIISFVQYEINKFENETNPYLIGAIIKFVVSAIIVVKNKNIAKLLLK